VRVQNIIFANEKDLHEVGEVEECQGGEGCGRVGGMATVQATPPFYHRAWSLICRTTSNSLLKAIRRSSPWVFHPSIMF
jgi:hypothetical protein